ncbi:hypothetical protein JHN63_33445 [Streptomyces sp. MBT65]|uniref:hypothetical protein n=1 Tax=Streptomyces sp. MBT65 TaxID=1488395 RepID=UPI00190E2D10|nr:hypothetical protein [Streptomyces sp. MBT65]MBK3578619.1 hypothetical protein [Streptomyces sp. MBT65]
MTRSSPDCIVVTLVEIQGGPAKWERVERHFGEVAWSFRTPSAKERRTARRAFESDPADSRFLWVDIPVIGSPWRAVREASWAVADVCRATRVTLYDRILWREESDRTMQPGWQTHSTRALARATRPPHSPSWSQPVWWLRRVLYNSAVRTGLFDDRLRVNASRSAAVVDLVREMTTPSDVDLRPLDGRGRPSAVLHGENALNRALSVVLGLLFTAGFLLALARHATPVGVAVCWSAALLSTGVAGWTGIKLPLARTRPRSALGVLAMAAPVLFFTVGIPGVTTGATTATVAGTAGVFYYSVGLVLLGRRWKWQLLLAGVLPLIATLAVATLPLTSRFLHDIYADELSLTPAETSVSSIWRLGAAMKLLWPSLGALLAIAAGWGIVRYFHFIRPRSIPAATMATFAVVVALVTTASAALHSPKAAADALKQAAVHGTDPPPYFGITPEWTCVTPTVPTAQLTEKGGALTPAKPYVSFGVADGQVVLWNTATARPLRIPADQVRLTPRPDSAHTCRRT